MTRRDIIIIAVLANMGVLALLFMLAFRTDEEKMTEHPEIAYNFVQEQPISQPLLAESEVNNEVEIDLLDEPTTTASDSLDEEQIQFIESEPAASLSKPEDNFVSQPSENATKTVEITVKKGDALEKIARSNGTTVEAIMKASHLKNDKLKIGQVLQVPVNEKPAKANPKPAASKSISQADEEYYIIKSGDNPWKIAKQFHIKVDDLLKLNNMDEESARNLKVGEKVRVR